MKIRLTIPVLLGSLLLATAPAPGMAAGEPRPATHHCVASRYAMAYPSASRETRAPSLDGYPLPYPRADLDGGSHHCLASSPATLSGATQLRLATGSGATQLRLTVASPRDVVRRVSQVAIPYPTADLDGDTRPSTVRYALPYPSADVDGDGPTLFLR